MGAERRAGAANGSARPTAGESRAAAGARRGEEAAGCLATGGTARPGPAPPPFCGVWPGSPQGPAHLTRTPHTSHGHSPGGQEGSVVRSRGWFYSQESRRGALPGQLLWHLVAAAGRDNAPLTSHSIRATRTGYLRAWELVKAVQKEGGSSHGKP